jgi:hypothetical protein
MRIALVAAAVFGLGLSACASSGTGEPSYYSREMARLRAECDARDGILMPSGANSGEPARDNACEIRGGSPTLPPRN